MIIFRLHVRLMNGKPAYAYWWNLKAQLTEKSFLTISLSWRSGRNSHQERMKIWQRCYKKIFLGMHGSSQLPARIILDSPMSYRTVSRTNMDEVPEVRESLDRTALRAIFAQNQGWVIHCLFLSTNVVYSCSIIYICRFYNIASIGLQSQFSYLSLVHGHP